MLQHTHLQFAKAIATPKIVKEYVLSLNSNYNIESQHLTLVTVAQPHDFIKT